VEKCRVRQIERPWNSTSRKGREKWDLRQPAVLFFLRVQQAEQHFLDAAGADGLELLFDSGLRGCAADFDGRGWLLGFKGTGKSG
jgi:hypothetical protein